MKAQARATERQWLELQKLIPQGDWPCVSCGKVIEKCELLGHENDAVVMVDCAGYGSRHDTSKIWLVICDDCVETKCIMAGWLEYLGMATDPEPATPRSGTADAP